MSGLFAKGSRAWGICDRCGMRYRLKDLKGETVRLRPVHNRVCKSCWDADHPQNMQGMRPVVDAEALRDPRPDTGLAASRELTGEYDPTVFP